MTEQIRNTQAKIQALEQNLLDLEAAGGLKKFFNHKRVSRNLERLNDLQFDQIENFLHKTSNEFQQIAKDIHEMLEADHIEFLVYTEDRSFAGSHVTRMNGTIYDNGYSYSRGIKNNVNWLPFDSMSFPSRFSGSINYWGEIELIKAEGDYSFLKNVPKKLSGTISELGEIDLVVVDKSWDFSDGQVTMGKLIANHFGDDPYENAEFQNKKASLSHLIHGYWEEIKLQFGT